MATRAARSFLHPTALVLHVILGVWVCVLVIFGGCYHEAHLKSVLLLACNELPEFKATKRVAPECTGFYSSDSISMENFY